MARKKQARTYGKRMGMSPYPSESKMSALEANLPQPKVRTWADFSDEEKETMLKTYTPPTVKRSSDDST